VLCSDLFREEDSYSHELFKNRDLLYHLNILCKRNIHDLFVLLNLNTVSTNFTWF